MKYLFQITDLRTDKEIFQADKISSEDIAFLMRKHNIIDPSDLGIVILEYE